MSVIGAVLLIFFYLFSVLIPLFTPATVDRVVDYAAPSEGPALRYLVEEQGEIGTRVGADGAVAFFRLSDGTAIKSERFALPADVRITSFADGTLGSGTFVLGLSNGTALVSKFGFDITFKDGGRVITPTVTYPFGETPITVDAEGQAIDRIAFVNEDDGATIAARLADGRLKLAQYTITSSLMGDSTVESVVKEVTGLLAKPEFLMVSGDQRSVLVADERGFINFITAQSDLGPYVSARRQAVKDGEKITVMTSLLGGFSAIVGTDQGSVSQWFPVRDAQNRFNVERIRVFREKGPAIRMIEPEHRRKGFLVVDQAGDLGIYLATAHREVYRENLFDKPVVHAAIAPRANFVLFDDEEGAVRVMKVHNEHPEVSMSSLWSKVWYEGYDEPQYLWQSSAASADFEPKYSLVPLTFGTLKAAFYAMIISVPLAISAAIFTGFFMAPSMRQSIKPTIEIMEALPTVVLGFLAGLWLAPYIEKNMPGMISMLILIPLGIIAASILWFKLPREVRSKIPDGWEGAILVPVVLFMGWLSLRMSVPMENALFGGDIRIWLRDHGITYDQRNSLVVGFAMGFAVIPVIFAIAEDAIFSVPRHLVNGSLALGATPWQTLVGVVLPTASPAMFSALMIGFGRAVGETMIVLMATGNTPVLDWNIFQGMRTLAANIAVEMPEAEVASTHFRVLFLTAFILLAFTFALNTVAEIVRQRLRKKYSSL